MTNNTRTNFVTLMPHMDEAFGFTPTKPSVIRKISHTFDFMTHEHTVTLAYIVTEQPPPGAPGCLLELHKALAIAMRVGSDNN